MYVLTQTLAFQIHQFQVSEFKASDDINFSTELTILKLTEDDEKKDYHLVKAPSFFQVCGHADILSMIAKDDSRVEVTIKLLTLGTTLEL